MTNFKNRLSQLEESRQKADLKAMSDEELEAYINTMEPESPDFIIALITKINRHGSTLPIIYDDPEYPSKKESPV